MVGSVFPPRREVVDVDAMAASARAFRGSVFRTRPEGFFDLTVVV